MRTTTRHNPPHGAGHRPARRGRAFALAAVAAGLLVPAAAAARDDVPRGDSLVEQVNRAVKRGVDHLLGLQRADGSWEVANARRGGETSLVLLALLNAGLKPDEAHVARGLDWLRRLEPEHTYVVGLQTMVFAAAGDPADKVLIQRNADWLINARLAGRNGELAGWTYQGQGRRFGMGDNSNTQYALLGLHEAHRAGARIPRAVWLSIREYYTSTQHEGAWGYQPQGRDARLTMTTAGLCGLIIAGTELNQSRERIHGDGLSATNCGRYRESEPIKWALEWIGANFALEDRMATYYNLYGIERAGRLSGLRYLGRHDWYHEGCVYLADHQGANGSWGGRGGLDSAPTIATSFALLFLSKGRTPVLLSKMVHGPKEDWNNDRNDARHLVEYASRELFKGQPLAWQAFDARHSLADNAGDGKKTVGELLQSPLVYFNGHKPPQFRDGEWNLLKDYVEQGGFIVAEACCSKDGEREFGGGFREGLVKLGFDADALQPLPPDHPIWRAHYLITPPAGYQLYGVQQGCKTVVVYSPQDLSCYWEENDTRSPRGRFAFELGANIIAYATGMELPKWRGSDVEVLDGREEAKIPRGFLKAVQLRHGGDWQPAPHAMPNLMRHLRDKLQLEVVAHTEALKPGSAQLLDYRFLYMHGRNNFSYARDPAAFKNLRSDLQTGGLLLADACCGSKTFDKAFRQFMKELFPDKALERIPLDDELFSKGLNGRAITRVRCRRESAKGTAPGRMQEVAPYLEGIRDHGRWVVIYSKYDIGCALERKTSPDCLGHDYESALRLGTAVVLYALKR
jgi:hypothetical protein